MADLILCTGEESFPQLKFRSRSILSGHQLTNFFAKKVSSAVQVLSRPKNKKVNAHRIYFKFLCARERNLSPYRSSIPIGDFISLTLTKSAQSGFKSSRKQILLLTSRASKN
jgi:hypothetical protein